MKGEMLQQNVPWRRAVRPTRNRGAAPTGATRGESW